MTTIIYTNVSPLIPKDSKHNRGITSFFAEMRPSPSRVEGICHLTAMLHSNLEWKIQKKNTASIWNSREAEYSYSSRNVAWILELNPSLREMEKLLQAEVLWGNMHPAYLGLDAGLKMGQDRL